MTDQFALEQTVRFRLDRQGYLKQFNPRFQKPIFHGKDAIPVGNGDLAAVAWQPEHLTWMLNKCDIGAASQVARLRIESPDTITKRIGLLETCLSLTDATGTVTYEGGEMPESAHWMWRGRTNPAPKSTKKDLGNIKTNFYVPEDRNVFMLSYDETSPVHRPLRIVFERWIQNEYDGTLKVAVRDNTLSIIYSMEKESDVNSFAAVLVFDGFEGAVPKQLSDISVALEIPARSTIKGRVAIAVVTSLESGDPLEAATKLAEDALRTPEIEIREKHEQYWRDFWNSSFVDSGHPYLTALYHMALYELGITSCGAHPVNFNGALNLFSEKVRTWGWADECWCHNQSEVYLPLYTANHIELADNFHDWIARVHPETIKAAQQKFQVEGAHYPETMSWNFKVENPENHVEPSGIEWILSSGVRYALMLWNRYTYISDEEFLRSKAWPVIRDCAEFYANYAELGDDGLYHVEPTSSWETPPVGKDGHADCAAWRAIFPLAIKVARQLGVAEDRIDTWEECLDKAPPYPIHDDLFSAVMRDDGTPEPTDHWQWQLPNLSTVFPYSVIGVDSDPMLKRIADDTFERYRFNADAGHEFLPVIAARLGNPEWWRAALFQYIQFMQGHDQGLFNYYNLGGRKDMELGREDDTHPYLEGSGVMATAVNEMLLQSHNGTIRVFPAAPEHWHSRFILRAAGSFMVASEHRGSKGVPYIAIQALGGKRRICRVALPWNQGASLAMNEDEVAFEIVDGKLEFHAEPDSVYVLTPSGHELRDVPMLDIAFEKQYSPCRLGNVWFGSRAGTMNHTIDFPLW